MTILFTAIFITLAISFISSLAEGFLLSLTTAELESFKQKHPGIGARLEKYKTQVEKTTSAILTLNTLSNVAGSAVIGYLAGNLFENAGMAILTTCLTLVSLFICEILPKNIGVLFRHRIILPVTLLLDVVLPPMQPISALSHAFIRFVLPRPRSNTEEEREQEVLLLVTKGQREGIFSVSEGEMIANTLRLDDRSVESIMTPAARLQTLSAEELVSSLMQRIGQLRYNRLPVYDQDSVVGYVYRSDLLKSGAENRHQLTVRDHLQPLLRIAPIASIADLLQLLLKNKQEIALVETDNKEILGVVTLKDIIEHLVGLPRTIKT